MNTLWMVLIAVLVIYVAYAYAKRVDRNVIQADAKRATPASRQLKTRAARPYSMWRTMRPSLWRSSPDDDPRPR